MRWFRRNQSTFCFTYSYSPQVNASAKPVTEWSSEKHQICLLVSIDAIVNSPSLFQACSMWSAKSNNTQLKLKIIAVSGTRKTISNYLNYIPTTLTRLYKIK